MLIWFRAFKAHISVKKLTDEYDVVKKGLISGSSSCYEKPGKPASSHHKGWNLHPPTITKPGTYRLKFHPPTITKPGTYRLNLHPPTITKPCTYRLNLHPSTIIKPGKYRLNVHPPTITKPGTCSVNLLFFLLLS